MPTPGLWSATWLPDAPKGRAGGDRIPYIRARDEAQPGGGGGRISRSRRPAGAASTCQRQPVQTLGHRARGTGTGKDVSTPTHDHTYLSPRVRGPVPSPLPWCAVSGGLEPTVPPFERQARDAGESLAGVMDATGPRPRLVSGRVALVGARLAGRSVVGAAALSVVLAGSLALLRAWPRSRARLASLPCASCPLSSDGR
jgi:hypothetical protein